MKNKPVARTSSSVALAIAMALSQLVASNIAQADSVREWGYWDASTAAGPSSGGDTGIDNISVQNFNTAQNTATGQNIPKDQRVVGVDNGQFLLAANGVPMSDYVGYTMCYEGCGATRVGTVYINVTQGAERVADRSHSEDTYNYWSDTTYKYVYDTNHYDGNLAITGAFNGSAFNINDNAPDLAKQTTTVYANGNQYDDYSNTYINGESENAYFEAYLSSTNNGVDNNGPYQYGGIGTDTSWGNVLFGKPVAATQIAEQLRLGQTYNFNGYSNNRSNVQIAVNFQNATWNGTWGASNDYMGRMIDGPGMSQTYHNGFNAAGGISGSTLASKSVTGAGVAGVGFVTGGKVDATLVGVINGIDASAAAVIGKSVVTVQQAVGTTIVGDVFSAQSGFNCKGDCAR